VRASDSSLQSCYNKTNTFRSSKAAKKAGKEAAMSDFNNVEKIQNSVSNDQVKWFRRPRRPSTLLPGTQSESSNSRRAGLALLNGGKNEETEILTILHQELRDINEGMIRTNTALFELIAEMKGLHKPTDENSIS
jgi:hypothetical protein